MSLVESNDPELPVASRDLIFPIHPDIADDCVSSFLFYDSGFYGRQLRRESDSLRDQNETLWSDLIRHAGGDEASPLFHGNLVMYRILSEQAYMTGGRIPRFKPEFLNQLKADRTRRGKLVADACAIPFRDAMVWRNEARVNWISRHEQEYQNVLVQHIKPFRQDYFNGFYAGNVALYYLVKDGLAMPHLYS